MQGGASRPRVSWLSQFGEIVAPYYYIAPPPRKTVTCMPATQNSLFVITRAARRRLLQPLLWARRRPPDFCDLARLQASADDASSSSSVYACTAARILDRSREQGEHHRITSGPSHFWCTFTSTSFTHSLSELPLFDRSGSGVAGEWARGVRSVTSNEPPGHSSGRTHHGVWHGAKAAGARLLL